MKARNPGQNIGLGFFTPASRSQPTFAAHAHIRKALKFLEIDGRFTIATNA